MNKYVNALKRTKTFQALSRYFKKEHAEEDEARARQKTLNLVPTDPDSVLAAVPSLIKNSLAYRTDDAVPRDGMEFISIGVDPFPREVSVWCRVLWRDPLPRSPGLTIGQCLSSIMDEQMNLYYRQGATIDAYSPKALLPNLARQHLSIKSDEAASAEADHRSRGYVEKMATCGIPSLEALFSDEDKWIPFLSNAINQFFFGPGSYQPLILRCLQAQEWALTHREAHYAPGNHSMPSYRVEHAAIDSFRNIKANTVTIAGIALQKWMQDYDAHQSR